MVSEIMKTIDKGWFKYFHRFKCGNESFQNLLADNSVLTPFFPKIEKKIYQK
jgi:hypothetical protein